MRALELSGNRLVTMPAKAVAQLDSLRVLRLSGNQLTAAGMPWAELASCTSLLTLVLDSNPCAACPQCQDTQAYQPGSIFALSTAETHFQLAMPSRASQAGKHLARRCDPYRVAHVM